MPYFTKNQRPIRVLFLIIAILGTPAILIGLNQFSAASGLRAETGSTKVYPVRVGGLKSGPVRVWTGNSAEILSTQQVLCQIGTTQKPRFETECHATVSVPRRKFDDLEIGQRVVIEAKLDPETNSNFPNADHIVGLVVSLFDTGGEGVLVTFAFSNNKEAKLFSQGQFATLWINTSTEYSVPCCSPVFVMDIDGKPYVLIAQHDPSNSGQIVVRKDVQIGLRDIDSVEIISGLDPGDKIIFPGEYAIPEGASIKVAKLDNRTY